MRVRGGEDNVRGRNANAFRGAATYLGGQIGCDRGEIASHDGGLYAVSTEDDGPRLQRIERSGGEPLMVISAHREALGRRDVRLGHANEEFLVRPDQWRSGQPYRDYPEKKASPKPRLHD